MTGEKPVINSTKFAAVKRRPTAESTDQRTMNYEFEQLRTLAEERLPDAFAPDEDGNTEGAGNLSGFRV